MKLIYSIVLLLLVSPVLIAQNEVEPNNSFATADSINSSIVKTGSTTNLPNDPDYFSTVLVADGGVTIYLQATNAGGANGYLYLYGYDSRQGSGQILAKYVSNNSIVAPGQTIYDTITLFGRAAETFYLRLESSGPFNYTLRYELRNTSVNDMEVNNNFDEALPIQRKQDKQGHIGYIKAGVTDADDYYKATLPLDGTLKIFVKATNRSGANGYTYLYVYDARQGAGQVLAKYIANNTIVANNQTVYDTIVLFGRSAEDFYFRLISAGAFDYTLSYDMTDSSANEAEPNNSFETSLLINQLQQLKGQSGYVKSGVPDADDYYKTTLPVDGALKIIIEGTNQSGANGYLYIYGYDGRKGAGQVLSKYIANNSTVAAGQTVKDTVILFGRAADDFYFRLQSAGGFSYSIKYDLLQGDDNDVEPNNTFEESVPLNQLDEKKGHIGYVKGGGPDGNDYYKTVIPIDGTLKVFVKGTNKSGGNGYLYLYGYDRRKGAGQIFATYIGGNSNVANDSAITDSITIYGVLADTFYFRMYSYGAFDYSIKYNTTPNSQFDEEPNNTFDESTIVKQGISKNGQVGYQLGGVRDNSDYYKTLLPADGTMKIYVQGNNNSGSNGYLYLYGYDKRQGAGQVLARYVNNNSNVAPGASVFDTIYLYGRAADSFYLRFESVGAFSYSFSYDIVDTTSSDLEPNNTFEQALPIERLERKRGHTGYVKSGGGDADDYYVAPMPEDGTLKIVVKGTNRNGTPGYLYLYAYDGRLGAGQILAKYIGNNSNVAAGADVFDTITLYGRAADTIYFRMASSGAFNYSIDFDVLQTSNNDVENNDMFEQAININANQIKKGHIGYVKRGLPDGDDYYKAFLPANGSLKIYLQGTNRSGANSYLYIYGYDQRKGAGQVLAKYVANSSTIQADSTIADSITLYGRESDTFYFRIQAPGAFSYSLQYALADTSILDVEPNNNFDQALAIDAGEDRKGNIGYLKIGAADSDDYYKTQLPDDGTLKIYLQGKNKSGNSGYLYLYGYDSRKGGGQVLAKYIANNSNVANDSTIYDTIYLNCRAIDSFYFRVVSAGAFSYSLQYEMLISAAGDTEPNNTFATGTKVPVNTTANGRIGYVKGAVVDADDYFKTPLNGNGTAQIIVEATNTSGGAGYLFIYGYDNRKGNGQILARYLNNNSNVAAGAVIRDTITLNCYKNDTLFTRFISSGCFTYSFKVAFINRKPTASFETVRVGNTFGFSMKQDVLATGYTWSFGNNTTSRNIVPPLVTYVPGFYVVSLVAQNVTQGCTFTDTAKTSFTIKGIERYTPNKGGTGNTYFTIYGGGLTKNTRVTLTKGSTVIVDSLARINLYGNIYNCLLDLHNAPVGFYNVTIKTNDSTYVYPNGFEVQPLVDKLRIEIVGNEQVRANVDNMYYVRVYNEGNTVTGVSKVYLLTPTNITVTSLDSSLPISSTQYVNTDTLPQAIYVTRAGGWPIDGYVQGFYIYGIPAGGFKDLRFKFNFAAGANDVYAWSSGPISGSPERPWISDCWKARSYLAYQTINFPLDLIPLVDCAWNIVKLGFSALNFLNSAIQGSFSDSYDAGGSYVSVGKTGIKAAKNCAGEVGVATTGPAGLALEAADIGTDIGLNVLSVQQAYYEWQEKCKDEPKDNKKKKTDARTSWDPNAKTGPSGIGAGRYINGKDRLLNYTIFFENLPTATLPASTVFIYDTLDTQVYDLRTLKVESFSIGTNIYNFSSDQNQYVANVNVSAALAVRVTVFLDTATGVLKGSFITLDRTTNDKTTDQLAGFLPPNTQSPNGQGNITYSIQMKNSLPDGTKLSNKASIIFDNNPPIITDLWTNTLDVFAPSSTVASVNGSGDSSALVNINGTDATSGVEKYNFYSSENGGAWQKLGHVGSTVSFIGHPGKSYRFYVTAIDSVGNEESKSARVEGTITFPGSLPVTMLPLKAIKDGSANRLLWSTVTEVKNKGFVVERSVDGRRFSPLGFVNTKAANGISTAALNYDYVDVVAPKKAYYRLQQTDIDLRTSYSNVVTLDRNKAMTISVYPNPASAQIFVNSDVPLTGLRLTEVSGRQVKQFVPSPNNRYSIAGLPNGVYVLQVMGKDTREQIKLVIRSN